MEIQSLEANEAQVENERKNVSKLCEKAIELSNNIVDYKSCAIAAAFLLDIKKQRKLWAEFNKPAKQKLDALKSELLKREREIDAPMEHAENSIIKPAIARFEQEQEAIRLKKQLEEEQKALQAAIDEKLNQAIKAESLGEPELSKEILSEVVTAAPVVIPKMEMPKGISIRETWKFRVVDETKIPREYLTINEMAIGQVVRALKKETRIPGIEIYCEKTVSGRQSNG